MIYTSKIGLILLNKKSKLRITALTEYVTQGIVRNYTIYKTFNISTNNTKSLYINASEI